MPKDKPVYSYYINGFSFLNKNIELYLIFIAFLFINTLFSLLGKSVVGLILSLLSIIIRTLQFGYQLSLPVFLHQKQKGVKLTYNFILDTTMRTTKRSLIPGMLFGILLLVCFLLYLGIIFAFQKVDTSNINILSQQLKNIIYQPNLYYIIPITIVFSYWVFFSIFFSLEMNSFGDSITKSINYSLKNLIFTLILISIYIVVNFIVRVAIQGLLLENQVELKWWSFLYQSLTSYSSFGLTASALLYYQDHTKTSLQREKTK